MTEVTRHEPGSFSWAELATSDPKAAKSFYGGVFGWTFVDSPMGAGPEDIYTRVQVRAKDVGALYRMMPDQAAQGVPPHWMCYVTVASADTAAAKALSLGGKVLAPAFDVMTYGRMAILQDPEGAALAVWEPRDHIGAERVNEPGAFGWMELASRNVAGAKAFYTGLFGWGLKDSEEYPEFVLGGRSIGGILPIRAEMGAMPAAWGVYWQVADCDGAVAKAKALGGAVLMGPRDIEKVGRFAVIQDPQGAMFSIIQLA